MSKYTKGTWECRVTWNPLGYPCYQIEPVIPASQSSGNYLEISREHVANARVIAAIPEFVELAELVATLNPNFPEIGEGMLMNLVSSALRALNKADIES